MNNAFLIIFAAVLNRIKPAKRKMQEEEDDDDEGNNYGRNLTPINAFFN